MPLLTAAALATASYFEAKTAAESSPDFKVPFAIAEANSSFILSHALLVTQLDLTGDRVTSKSYGFVFALRNLAEGGMIQFINNNNLSRADTSPSDTPSDTPTLHGNKVFHGRKGLLHPYFVSVKARDEPLPAHVARDQEILRAKSAMLAHEEIPQVAIAAIAAIGEGHDWTKSASATEKLALAEWKNNQEGLAKEAVAKKAVAKKAVTAKVVREVEGKKNPWSEEEVAALEEGFSRWGKEWANILNDSKLHFELRRRNQTDLKDKWRNIERSKKRKLEAAAMELEVAKSGDAGDAVAAALVEKKKEKWAKKELQVQPATPSKSPGNKSFRTAFLDLYLEHAPEKLKNLDKVMKRYSHDLAGAYSAAVEKYTVTKVKKGRH